MPGMGTGLNANNPTVVAAFYSALRGQALIVLAILALAWVARSVLRSVQLRRSAGADASTIASRDPGAAEPPARRLLRISFGLIWIFDGILQGQASMPLGMAPQVIRPAAAASPGWVQHLDNAMATVWSYHPIAAPAAAVWIQIGIGVWLLAAPRGNWSRLGGLFSAGWGLIVWSFGEAFGGIFAPGLTWLFGAPGAVLFYCLAGVLVALPERYWATPRLGRAVLRLMGGFFVGMAILQAWPGRGFWQGQPRASATPGTLTSMVTQMAQTPQPSFLASWVAGFKSFDAAHGWAVNLFVVCTLAIIGAAFLSAVPRVVRVAVFAAATLCLADWVLIEDLGFLGGVGTDPNSMIPMALIFVAGYVAIRQPAVVRAQASAVVAAAPVPVQPWRDRLVVNPTYTFRAIVALAAIGITLVGAVPMAFAATNPHADPILAKALGDSPQKENRPAPPFDLIDQFGRPVSLAGLRGKTVALAFLDPVCTFQCPLIGQELRIADGLLGADAHRVEMVAIDANPTYITPDYLAAFDHQESLDGTPNWLYLTGSLPELQAAWKAYGILVQYSPGGAMIDHGEYAYVIDPSGHTRLELGTDPGPGSEATISSFSVSLANAIDSVVRSS